MSAEQLCGWKSHFPIRCSDDDRPAAKGSLKPDDLEMVRPGVSDRNDLSLCPHLNRVLILPGTSCDTHHSSAFLNVSEECFPVARPRFISRKLRWSLSRVVVSTRSGGEYKIRLIDGQPRANTIRGRRIPANLTTPAQQSGQRRSYFHHNSKNSVSDLVRRS